MKRILLAILILVLFLASIRYREGFLEARCADYNDCVSCANKADCTWCTSSHSCLTKSQINNDSLCNPMNLVHDVPMCTTGTDGVVNRPNNAGLLGENQIADRIKPPNVFVTEEQEYSPETVMAQTTHVRNELQAYQQALPGIMANTVKEQIGPMIRGIQCEPAPFL